MQNRMSTRRCVKGKIPCQEIQNIFAVQNNHHLTLIPDDVWKSLPTTQKVSCEIIEKMKQLLPKHSNEETLRQIRDNVRLQYNQILKIVGQVVEPENVQLIKQEKGFFSHAEEIRIDESPIRKIVKRDNCTRQVSDYDSEHYKGENIFADEKVIERLEDYLSID